MLCCLVLPGTGEAAIPISPLYPRCFLDPSLAELPVAVSHHSLAVVPKDAHAVVPARKLSETGTPHCAFDGFC